MGGEVMGSSFREAIRKTAFGLYKTGFMDEKTLQEYNDLCLMLTPEEIRELRVREGLTQADFAMYLNTTRSVIDQWESGAKKPNGVELKLLDLIKRNGVKGIS
jgi:putative transcriptional regulator